MAALIVVGFLYFRLVDLEQRVARLSEQLVPAGAKARASSFGARPSTATPTASAATSYERRLAALQKRVDALTEASRGPLPSDLSRGSLHDEERILSVMERENSRVRDIQLEWHRARWMEGRTQQLSAFATQVGLDQRQTDELKRALQHETDGLIAVMKDPHLAEDPDQAASDWLAVLNETDERAKLVLKPDQEQAWTQARMFERRALWPWIPKQAGIQN